MKSMFRGYQAFLPDLTLPEIKKSMLCFDTSALLNLYRYPQHASEDFIKAIEYFQQNIWLPYIVALEYQDNRMTVLQQQARIFEELSSKSKKFKNDILGLFADKEHYSISYIEIENILDKFNSEFEIFINKSRENHPNYFRKDPIQIKIMELFDGKVGNIPSIEDLKELYNEGEIRFNNKIPPGYKDAKNKETETKLYGNLLIKSKYSDFIIWNEIINRARETKNSVILVTDERKEDWCWKENNIILGARPELVTEMFLKAGVNFRLVSSSQFISVASKIRKISISKSSVSDIEESLLPSWKDIILQAFRMIGPIVKLEELYAWIEQNQLRPLTPNWKVTARKTIYYYCKERDIFLGKEVLFEALNDSTYKLI